MYDNSSLPQHQYSPNHIVGFRTHQEVHSTSLFLTSNKENKHSLHVGALKCEQMSSVTWKDVVDLDEIYLRNACKSPVSNTAYLTLRSSNCRSTCRPAHMTPNFVKTCCDFIQCSIQHSNNDVQIHTARSLARIYTKFCVLITSVKPPQN